MTRDLAARAATVVSDQLHDSLRALSEEVGVDVAAEVALATCVGAARAFQELRAHADAACDARAELNVALGFAPRLN